MPYQYDKKTDSFRDESGMPKSRQKMEIELAQWEREVRDKRSAERNRENRASADKAQDHQKQVDRGNRSPRNRNAVNVAGALGSSLDDAIEYRRASGKYSTSGRGAEGIKGNQGSQSGPRESRNYGPSAMAKRIKHALKSK